MTVPTYQELLRDWAAHLTEDDLGDDRGQHRGDALFGWRSVAFQRLVGALEEGGPRLAPHFASHGYLWRPEARGRNSRHIAVLPAGLPGYWWLGVENRYFDWAHLGTPVKTGDVTPLLEKWGLLDARWSWSTSAPLLTCPWKMNAKTLPTGKWAYLAGAGDVYIAGLSSTPWSRAPSVGATEGVHLGQFHRLSAIMAMGRLEDPDEWREVKNVLYPYAKGAWRYRREEVVLQTLLDVGAGWAHVAAVRGNLDPTGPLDEQHYAQWREVRREDD